MHDLLQELERLSQAEHDAQLAKARAQAAYNSVLVMVLTIIREGKPGAADMAHCVRINTRQVRRAAEAVQQALDLRRGPQAVKLGKTGKVEPA